MSNITIRELKFEDKEAFLKATVDSQSLHHPWVTPPLTSQEFGEYWQRFQQSNQKITGMLEAGEGKLVDHRVKNGPPRSRDIVERDEYRQVSVGKLSA